MMKIEVIDLVMGKSCTQDTKELKNKTEKEFMEYLHQKKQANVLDYKLIS